MAAPCNPDRKAATPQISIIIPVLNEGAAIADLLATLAAWRAAGDEVIVSDGGSHDATVSLARAACDCVVTAARGRALQMNAGAAVARGQILWFLHADSVVSAGAREALLAACTATPAWGRFDVWIADDAVIFRVIGAMMNLRSRLSAIATGDHGIFVTRALFNAVGGYASLALMEDIELSAALARYRRPHCLRLTLGTSSRRWRSRGIARTIVSMWALRLAWFCGISASRLARWYGYR